MSTKKIVTATGLYQGIGNGCNENKSLMSLKTLRQNLTKTTAVAAVIGIATSLFPAIAQAQAQASDQAPVVTPLRRQPLPKSSLIVEKQPDDPANVRVIKFSLDTSFVEDIKLAPDLREFPGAIQNFEIDSYDDNFDLFRESGTLTISRLTIDPSNSDVLPRIPDSDGDNIGFNRDLVRGGTFNNDWLRFDATFPDTPTTLTLFIPSNDPTNDPSLINSLSGLDEILLSGRVQAVVSRPDLPIPQNIAKFVESNQDPARRSLTFARVPEPTATASLLGVGTLGAITVLKRNKRLRKSV